MTRLRSSIAFAIGLGTLLVGIVLGTSAPAISQAIHDVLVVNTTGQQVPVEVVNTATQPVPVAFVNTSGQGVPVALQGKLTQVSGPFTIVAISGAAIGPRVDTTSCHSVLALVSINTSVLPPLNPLDLRLEMFEPGGHIVGRVTGTIVNDTVFQATAAEFVVNGAPVVPPVSQLEYQNHNNVNISVNGIWLYCAP